MPLAPHHPIEFTEVNRKVARLFVRHCTGLNEPNERLVHRLHALITTGLDDCIELVRLAFTDNVTNRWRCDENFSRHRASTTDGRDEPL